MSVNRSGYYKWLARKGKPNRYEQDRAILTELLMEQHKKHGHVPDEQYQFFRSVHME